VEAQIALVSAERQPLAVFGTEASRLVGGVLAERGVRFLGGVVPTGVRRDGALMLQSEGAVAADRVVAVPVLRGRRITGVPASWQGFVPADFSGRVEGLEDVYAAGDITSYPIKQGGLATQQADRVAHTIASALGAPVKEFRAEFVLRARLLGGEHPVFLRTELDAAGKPTAAALEHPEKQEAASSAKLFARYLTPYLETLKPVSANQVAAA
jgi:sulfide:quinone oxidoreductase